MFKFIFLTLTPNLIYMKNVKTHINAPWIPASTRKRLEWSLCSLYRWNRYVRFKRSTRQWPHTPTHPLLWNEFSALSWGSHCGTGTTIELTFRSWLIFIRLFCSTCLCLFPSEVTPYILYIFITSAVTIIPQKNSSISSNLFLCLLLVWLAQWAALLCPHRTSSMGRRFSLYPYKT